MLTIEELLYALMLPSGNDAAETLADIATTRLELDWEPTISLRSGIADLINQESLF